MCCGAPSRPLNRELLLIMFPPIYSWIRCSCDIFKTTLPDCSLVAGEWYIFEMFYSLFIKIFENFAKKYTLNPVRWENRELTRNNYSLEIAITWFCSRHNRPANDIMRLCSQIGKERKPPFLWSGSCTIGLYRENAIAIQIGPLRSRHPGRVWRL